MKVIRLGNDIHIKWTIMRGNVPEMLSGKHLIVELMNCNNEVVEFDYDIKANVIEGTYYGMNQYKAGAYKIKLVENKGEHGMVTLEQTDCFVLVNTLNGRTSIGNDDDFLSVETVNLTSTIDFPSAEVAPTYEYNGITLIVEFSNGATKFANLDEYKLVYDGMQAGCPPNFRICVVFASGSKNFFYPTCIKTNYISLHAKAGSCELRINADGTFSRSGTNLW